jgi:HlyD family secretion protein
MDVPRHQAITKRQVGGLVSALLLLIAIAFFAYDFIWKPTLVPEIVKSGSFIQTIVASGHVESPHRISISAQITDTNKGGLLPGPRSPKFEQLQGQ